MPSVPAVLGQHQHAPRPAGARHGGGPAVAGPARPARDGLRRATVDVERLGRGQRAHAVDQLAAGPHEGDGRLEQLALQVGQRVDVVGLDAPTGIGAGGAATPSPEHGASTRTRSARPSAQRRPSGRRRRPRRTRGRAQAPGVVGHQPGPGRMQARAATTARRSRPGRSPCRPVRRTASTTSSPGSGARRRRSTHCEAGPGGSRRRARRPAAGSFIDSRAATATSGPRSVDEPLDDPVG